MFINLRFNFLFCVVHLIVNPLCLIILEYNSPSTQFNLENLLNYGVKKKYLILTIFPEENLSV